MKSFMVSLVGLVLSVSVGAEPLLKGRVWLASGPPAAGVQVRLFDLTDLRRSVGTTTDEAGYFALPLAPVGGPVLPQGFALGQNYPNPFNPSTIIPYQIPTTTHVRLEVFNLLGQRLATLVDGERPAGAHTAQWDATDAMGRAVGAGVFIYRLTGGGHTVSRRMVLIDGQAGLPAGAAGPRQTAAVGVQTAGSVYGLTVAGAGLIAYVDPAFQVGTDKVNLVLEQPGGQARMKVATGGILGDVNNDSQVDAFDVLYVALYSKDSSITLPNNGDISLGDVNGDGTVDLADGLLLALYTVNPSDPTLPPGIGQPVDGSGDDHGDSPSSATALAVGSSRSGQLETGGDVDYFRVAVSASGELTVHTTGSLDTKGQLEDSAGEVLVSDDDGGEGHNFRLAHTVSAGTYYIKVEGYNASTTGRYTIHASGPGGDGPVNIPDANLRAVIAEALDKAPNAPITPDEMASLTQLIAPERNIASLVGLEHCTALEKLHMWGNQISDVSPLAGLTNLQELALQANQISDLSSLTGLTNLQKLHMWGNQISDLSSLAGLTNLQELWMDGNQISDLSSLTGLTNLQELTLGGNQISDVSPLTGLTNLQKLNLWENRISDISPLVANTGLGSGDEVDLRNNPLSSTSLNTHIPALESRGVTVHYGSGGGDDHGDTPSSATALAVGSSRSGQLETGGDVDYFQVQVSASGELIVHTTGSLDTKGQLEDSAGEVLASDDDGGDGYNFRLAYTVSAGTYYIKVEGYNASTTGSYTIHASGPGGDGTVNIPDANLRAVIAEALDKSPNAPITSDEMATLTALTAVDKGIRNLAGLEFATNLTWLQFDTNRISDVSPLAGLTNLTWLHLSLNNISDVSPLAGLTNLESLGLIINNISDISPLVANTGLGSGDEVFLEDNPLSSTSLNTHIPALQSRGVTVHFGDSGIGDDHGDTRSDATSLAVGSSLSGQLETGGDVDYFRVAVSASGELIVHTTGSLDTKGQLEDSAGGVLARDDDGGDGYNFRLAYTVSAGTYYIKVEGYNASTTGSYTIHASGPGGGDGGPVNIADANLRAVIAEALGKAPNAPITPDEMATLTNLNADDKGIRDLTGLEFATNLIELLLYSNSISDVSPLAGLTNLTRLNLSGNNISDVSLLAGLTNLESLGLTANNITDVSPLVANTGLGSGDEVFLYFNPLSSTSLNTHIPALESRGVTVYYDEGSGDDHGDSPSSATALAVGSSRSGQLETGGDVDYFQVQVSASGELTVYTSGSLDTKGELENSAGATLASDDDGGDGYNFRLAHTVSAGTYYIKVEGYNASTTGSYTIHASGPGDPSP